MTYFLLQSIILNNIKFTIFSGINTATNLAAISIEKVIHVKWNSEYKKLNNAIKLIKRNQ